mgnify:CR=1 FL=1
MAKVVVTFALEPELAQQIRAVDSNLDVTVLGEGQLELLRGKTRFPSERQAATSRSELQAALEDAQLLFSFWGGGLRRLVRAEEPPAQLRWVQLSSAGADRVDPELIHGGLTFTTVSGLHAVPIAEFVLAYMLMFENQANSQT